jgi:hypothetical protein
VRCGNEPVTRKGAANPGIPLRGRRASLTLVLSQAISYE